MTFFWNPRLRLSICVNLYDSLSNTFHNLGLGWPLRQRSLHRSLFWNCPFGSHCSGNFGTSSSLRNLGICYFWSLCHFDCTDSETLSPIVANLDDWPGRPDFWNCWPCPSPTHISHWGIAYFQFAFHHSRCTQTLPF